MSHTAGVADTKPWLWLQKGSLKIETESPITTAQDQVLKTNLTKAKIDESQNNPTVCAKRKMKGSCTSFQDVVNWQRKSTRRDMIA